jgi:dTDP-4-amino-4,6-dideoxygalactose transaminase
VFKRKEDLERARKMINFGITGPETIEELGINAKMNELQAAMGLCVLDEMETNLNARSAVWTHYESELKDVVKLQKKSEHLSYNSAYFPAVFETELQATAVAEILKENSVLVRRYFYPSLENVEILGAKTKQPISNDIASRILCFPIYYSLTLADQKMIVDVARKAC